jgi:HAD superfamily hydrolase (TIGR01549 family)
MTYDDLSFWENDKSLRPLRDVLRRRPRPFQLVSFDFFDTLVCRFVSKPENLFIEAGRRIASEGLFSMSLSPLEFYSTRIAGQESACMRALAAGRSPEISIKEIYEALAPVLKDPVRAMQIEKETERDLCYVNPYTASLVKYVSSLGYRTAIISDTYLSSGDLKEILSRNRLDPNLFDFVVASNEAGCTKRDGGGLFRAALSEFGISGGEMLHIGDNFASDVEAASKFGISGLFYYQKTIQQGEILRSECALDALSHPRAISLNSLRLLSARRYASNDTFEDGAFTFGPVLARFADWSLDLFSRAGVKLVLALMREGELLGELLRRAAAANGVNLTVVPCYISRKSTALASLHNGITSGKLYELLTGGPLLRIRDALTILGVSREAEQYLSRETLFKEINSKELLDSVVNLVLGGKNLRTQIERMAAERHTLAFGYLSGMIGEERCIGVLDLGWSGSIQRSISRILRNGGKHVKTVGCYLSTTPRAGRLPLEGGEAHGFTGQLLTRGNLVMEVPILAPIGGTEGYVRNADGRVVPLLGPCQIDGAEKNLKDNLREGILAFQEHWLALKSLKGPRVFHADALAEIDSQNAPILLRLIDYPTKMEAMRLGSLHHDENYGDSYTRPLCDPVHEKVFRTQGMEGLFLTNCKWPQAVIARDTPRLMNGLSNRWNAPYAFGRLGGRSLYNGKPSSLTDEENRLLLEILEDHPHDQIIFFSSGLEGDEDFLKSLAAQREGSNGRLSKRPDAAENGHAGLPVQGGSVEFPFTIDIRPHVVDVKSIPVDGYLRISGNPVDPGTVRNRILPYSRCLLVLTEGMAESDVAPSLLAFAPFFGPGSMIATNHGRIDPGSQSRGSNIQAAVQQWYLQTGSKNGLKPLDSSPYEKHLPLYWTFLIKGQ